MKANGQTFGAARFAELCRELERRAQNDELEGTAALVDRIEHEYSVLERALAGRSSAAAS
jgi:HPt (histidine-containing phosphotransfer) domain-containing protein